MTSKTTNNSYALQCACAAESAKIHQELVVSKKSQADLVETVLQNLEGIQPEEKIEIISALKTELAEEGEVYKEKESFLKKKIKRSIEQLQEEIVRLIGAQAAEQQDKIRQLSQDLLNIQHGHHHAIGILFRRYDIAPEDLEMQKEVLYFISSIERAENTYQCISQLKKISGAMVSTEELIEEVLHDAKRDIGNTSESKDGKKRNFRIRWTEKIIQWLRSSLPEEANRNKSHE